MDLLRGWRYSVYIETNKRFNEMSLSAVKLIRRIDLAKFLAKEPNKIGSLLGYDFYEHPVYGDESTLVAVGYGQAGYTDFWEMPTIDELTN